MNQWGDVEITKGFHGCDCCGVGLGKFMYRTYSSRGEIEWEAVVGEDAYKWDYGKIKQKYRIFKAIYPQNGKPHVRLVSHTKTIHPRVVCWECLLKYMPEWAMPQKINVVDSV